MSEAESEAESTRFEPDPVRPSTRAAITRSFPEFFEDNCLDLGAGLTFWSVLSAIPALAAALALLGVVGDANRSVTTLEGVLDPVLSENAMHTLDGPLRSLATSPAAPIALVVSVALAVYSASAYVGAFGRAMNRIYEVDEGRPFWKRKPQQVLVTIMLIGLCMAAAIIMVVSGPVTRSVGDWLGAGESARRIWEIGKWPVLLIAVIILTALLYHATSNALLRSFRLITAGSVVAVFVWLAASAGFTYYVVNFAHYNRTYGSFAGVIILLIWLWLTNLALLYGAELDSELERNRQLLDGIPAEERLQMRVRDQSASVRRAARRDRAVETAREVRIANAGRGNAEDRPYR